MNKSIKRRKKTSFREAEGTLVLPAQLNWGQLDERFRIDLWDEIFVFFENGKKPPYGFRFLPEVEATAVHILRQVFGNPLDQALSVARVPASLLGIMKHAILNSSYDICLEIVQEMLRRHGDDSAFFAAMRRTFDGSRSPYLLTSRPPTIVPKGGFEEGHAVAKALEDIAVAEVPGSRSHLLSAADAINKGDWSGAIRESIHAVESAVKKLTGKPSAALVDALAYLGDANPIHPALKEAMKKLYSYTSDEKGIRHALIEGKNDKVGMEEAIFMYTSCAAFISYLLRKSGKLDLAD